MCFGSTTIDDPTQATRSTGLFHQKRTDPTQQPIHITESNPGSKSDSTPQGLKKRLGSYKNRAAFVDLTDQEPKTMTERPSNSETATKISSNTEAARQPTRGMPMDHEHWGGYGLPTGFGVGIGAASYAAASGIGAAS
jgi:hypothetical protein